jgi:hypothetical protein
MSSWNQRLFNSVVNQKFYDIDVQQMIQGKLVEVVERDLIREDVDGVEVEDDPDLDNELDEELAEYVRPQVDVQVNEEIKENDENFVKIQPKPLVKVIPKPTLSHEILDLQRRLNLTNPGELGHPVILPENLDFDVELLLNKSKEKYQINEFVSNLVRLDRELPDIRTPYCKRMKYSENLPKASVIMVFHNEAFSMILRSVYSVLNRSPENLLGEIILIDDCSNIGEG